MPNKPSSLYIHIPFCAHICSYCDFTKLFYSSKYEKPYLKALKEEIKSYKIDKVDTIYIGGGTPTALSDEGFEDLLAFIGPKLAKNGEFTVEANVENCSENKLNIMKHYGVNRLSIGVQSSNNNLLKEIGRNHSYEDAKKVIELAKKIGFNNINVDFIYGFKNQSFKDLQNDLKNYLLLDIDHVSIYSLIIEKGSILFNKGEQEQNETDSRKFYDFIVNFLRSNGYERYEISNFARNKKYSKHNITYWKNKHYYGVGLGASGYIDNVRYTNTKNIDDYLNHNFVKEKEIVDSSALLEYFLLTNLRMEKGFSRNIFKQEFGLDFLEMFGNKIAQNKLEKYFVITKDSIALNDEGLILMDFVLYKLI